MDAVQAFTPSPFLFFVIAIVLVTIVFIFSGVKQVPQACGQWYRGPSQGVLSVRLTLTGLRVGRATGSFG